MATKTITVRHVPDEVRNELAARAARSGRSLQEYLLKELTAMAKRPTAADVLADARRRMKAFGSKVTIEDILEARDEGRR